jgi:hypothetical protein
MLLLLSSSSCAAAATFAGALIAAGCLGLCLLVGDCSGSSSLLLLALLALLALLLLSGNVGNAATAILCLCGGCRLLRLWSNSFFFI